MTINSHPTCNETDQVQPIDRGLGRQVKIYLGQQLDEWLDDDDNLDKWTSNQLTASDRRILLACWYDKAVKKALEGEAKWKYFQHSGALLTADCTTRNRPRGAARGSPGDR